MEPRIFFPVAFAVLFALVVHDFLLGKGTGTDDTDPPGGRSNMTVYTDAKTGVQYLGTQRGGLTVRVDQYGWPMLEGQDTTKGDER